MTSLELSLLISNAVLLFLLARAHRNGGGRKFKKGQRTWAYIREYGRAYHCEIIGPERIEITYNDRYAGYRVYILATGQTCAVLTAAIGQTEHLESAID